MERCRYCGSTEGVYTKLTVRQYYGYDGTEKGYDGGDGQEETRTCWCAVCDRNLGYFENVVDFWTNC